MLEIIIYTLLSVLIVSLVSLIGIITLSLKRGFLDKSLLFLVSVSVGCLFGDVFIHLIPEIVEQSGTDIKVWLGVLFGIFIFFVLEEILHWRNCRMQVHSTKIESCSCCSTDCSTLLSPHQKNSSKEINKKDARHLAIMNLVGDGIHNFTDGIIIAGSYFVSVPVGIATTLAVILHEVPQEISDFGVLLYSGLSKAKALFYNFISALSAVIGAILGLVIGASSEKFVAFIIPVAAGGFIYIAGADLIPELHKHCSTKEILLHIFAFVLGVCLMGLLLLLE